MFGLLKDTDFIGKSKGFGEYNDFFPRPLKYLGTSS